MSSELRLLTPFETASDLVRSLYSTGLRHVIISPGSRSTPLTMAFSYHAGFKKQIILDERSAAFTALGIGKASGIPAILVCTSGTAVANYHPAVAEARQSGVPMLLCTADRPPSLRGIGSSQTLDQIKLFNDSTVWFHELGEPADSDSDRRRIAYAARQAKSEAIEAGGAVHLNIPFRKPLEPSASEIEQAVSLFEEQNSNLREQHEARPFTRSVSLSDEISSMINECRFPLIVAGPTDPWRSQSPSIRHLTDYLQAPILAEPGSTVSRHEHRVDHFEQYLRREESSKILRPDLILRFGDQPFTKSLLTALHRWHDVPLVHFSGRSASQDHEMSIDHTIELQAGDTLDIHSIRPKQRSNFLDSWLSTDSDAASTMAQSLEKQPNLCDGHLFHHLGGLLTNEWNVIYSNSLPVRDAALFGYPDSKIFLNRGAAGIDGITSTAYGTSRVSHRPTCCIIGDLAFLHDSNALMSLRQLDYPFVIVVINNGGGNIFRMLPIHQHQDVYTQYFETPQDVNIQDLANAHGIGYNRVESIDQIDDDLSYDKIHKNGVHIIECVTDADRSMALRKELWEA